MIPDPRRPFPGASHLGFGCASLGSRIAARPGLDAMAASFEMGVNWFDVAPSYGDGNAEVILSQFTRGRRSQIYICTKCGIVPPKVSLIAAALRPVARAIVARAPSLRRAAASARAPARRISFSAEQVQSSLEASLKRLRTDYVDVLALHEPSVSDLERDDVQTTFESILQSGKARALGIAGTPEAIETGLRLGLPLSHIQLSDGPIETCLLSLNAKLERLLDGLLIVTHSVFSKGPKLDALHGIGDLQRLSAALNELGYHEPLQDALRAATLDYALSSNYQGTVLVSMFSESHRKFNISRISEHSDARANQIANVFAKFPWAIKSDPSSMSKLSNPEAKS
jgi:predicted oxidoreductase